MWAQWIRIQGLRCFDDKYLDFAGFYTQLNSATHLNVIIVEDDLDLREETVLGLRSLGIAATGVGDAAGLYREMVLQKFDVVILDVGLPGEDGFSVLRHLRQSSKMGIVMLSARGTLEDRVQGLNDGADAYMVKPVDLKELVSVLGSLSRRLEQPGGEGVAAAAAQPAAQASADKLSWRLNKSFWTLESPQNITIPLTPKEYTFLNRLVERCGEPVPRAHIIHAFGGDINDFDFHRVEVIISRLRRKALATTGTPLPIKAIPGFGFTFTGACVIT